MSKFFPAEMIEKLVQAGSVNPFFSRKEIDTILLSEGYLKGHIKRLCETELKKAGFGKYIVSAVSASTSTTETPTPLIQQAGMVGSIINEDSYVPPVDKNYIPWGNFADIKQLVSSGEFFPAFITGESGNGKTVMVEQAAAKSKREFVRVQITPETDEDDLIGGFRLIDGNTVFFKGPVIKAMEAGAVLLIDELDRGTNKLMCLQGIMEGKPVLLKKTGQVITPAPGFTIIATANTKGRGSESGKFSAAGILDEAFLERFPITVDQTFPTEAIERRILGAISKTQDKLFLHKLVEWANVVRKTYYDEAIDEVISTRRLIHISKTYDVFNDKMKAIRLCINRFDDETRDVFLDLYTKVDNEVILEPEKDLDSSIGESIHSSPIASGTV
mgnify:FL=1